MRLGWPRLGRVPLCGSFDRGIFVAFILLLQLIKGFFAAGDHDTSGVVSMDSRRLGSCLFCVLRLDEACIGIFKLLLSCSGDILVTTP